MVREVYGYIGHKCVGNQTFLALMLLEQHVSHLLRPLYNQRCVGKENR